tara:strand:+ start:278 stop:904 length:627 start_codon:yes stop_codon:yes gene_type:complete
MNEEDSIDIITEKSKELLNYQVAAFDSNYSKAGTFISISSLFTPLAFSFFDKFNDNWTSIFLFFIPIALNVIGLYYLVAVLIPKKLYLGIGLQEFDRLLDEKAEKVKLFEIGANRSSFKDNDLILDKQNKFLRYGLRLIFASAVSLAIIILIQTINTNIMAENDNSNSENQTTQDSGNSGRQIPEVPATQRTIIEKGGENSGDTLKKK